MITRIAEHGAWTVYMCAEPDGEACDSGTHPNVLSHHCAAIGAFHDGTGEGPQTVAFQVAPAQLVKAAPGRILEGPDMYCVDGERVNLAAFREGSLRKGAP